MCRNRGQIKELEGKHLFDGQARGSAMQVSKIVSYTAKAARYASVYRRYKSGTMMVRNAYIENLALISRALENSALKDGAFIECGTWKGGMSAGMIEVGGPDRNYFFFDSFEGLPLAKEIDGPAAMRWQSDTDSEWYYNNCTASLEEFEATIAKTSCPSGAVKVYKGFFEETFPKFDPPSISVLRLDADWYESTMACLDKFWDSVLPGGLVLVDDYYTWDGCTRAVHEFLAKRRACEPVHQGPPGRVAYINKR